MKATQTCQTCVYYPKDCGYWALEGKKDKGGNLITLISPDAENGCPDFIGDSQIILEFPKFKSTEISKIANMEQ